MPDRKNSTSKSRDEKEYGGGVIETGAADVGSSLTSKNFLFRFEFENLSLGND